MTDHEHRHFSLRAVRDYLVELSPEGRRNLAVVFAWGAAMLIAAMLCGFAIGLLI